MQRAFDAHEEMAKESFKVDVKPKFYRHLVTWKDNTKFNVEDLEADLFSNYFLHYGVVAKETSEEGYVHWHGYFKTRNPVTFVGASDTFGVIPHCKGVTKTPVRAWLYVCKHGDTTYIGDPAGYKSMQTWSRKWQAENFSIQHKHDLPKVIRELPLKELEARQRAHWDNGQWDQFCIYSKTIFEVRNMLENKQFV